MAHLGRFLPLAAALAAALGAARPARLLAAQPNALRHPARRGGEQQVPCRKQRAPLKAKCVTPDAHEYAQRTRLLESPHIRRTSTRGRPPPASTPTPAQVSRIARHGLNVHIQQLVRVRFVLAVPAAPSGGSCRQQRRLPAAPAPGGLREGGGGRPFVKALGSPVPSARSAVTWQAVRGQSELPCPPKLARAGLPASRRSAARELCMVAKQAAKRGHTARHTGRAKSW